MFDVLEGFEFFFSFFFLSKGRDAALVFLLESNIKVKLFTAVC